MREHLIRLIDKPVVVRTGTGAKGSVGRVDFRVAAETIEGVVFEVGEKRGQRRRSRPLAQGAGCLPAHHKVRGIE